MKVHVQKCQNATPLLSHLVVIYSLPSAGTNHLIICSEGMSGTPLLYSKASLQGFTLSFLFLP